MASGSTKAELRNLSGPEKAAILMLALGDEYAARMFRMMDDEEIKEISQIMSSLGTLSSDLVEALLVEFADQISSTSNLVGTYETTERLLLASGLERERIEAIMEEIRGPAGRTMWDKLGNVNEQILANYLKNEYPQTVAVVLSKVKAEHSARILAALPEDFAMEVVMRMLRMEPVQKEVLDGVEKTLRAEFMNNLARTSRRDSHEMMAEIFNHLDRTNEARFLDALEARNKEAAEKIRSLMFTFEDLGKLDPSGVQTVLRVVDKDKLAIALKGASENVRDLFLSNMSERAGKMLREDMAAMGPVRLRDVDEAQNHMVAIAKDLAEKGEIIIVDGKGDDVLVY